MKLVTYLSLHKPQLGVVHGGLVYNLQSIDEALPDNMASLLRGEQMLMHRAQQAYNKLAAMPEKFSTVADYTLLAPVPQPTSCRDAYAFRQHVETSRRNRQLPMIPEFDQFPVFYFTNHNAIYGPGPVYCMPDHFNQLDFELECAIVIGTAGKNIPASKAHKHIAGFMIMNDLSARYLQMQEMKLNLGPAKGKDFATATGPWLVTPDELEPYKTTPPAGHTGHAYNLPMQCKVNGAVVSQGNLAQMDWTFEEIIERCSYGVQLYPGDVIGSGTVGTGCFLELNGTARLHNAAAPQQWLQPNDVVEMEITGLGVLTNIIKQDDADYSRVK